MKEKSNNERVVTATDNMLTKRKSDLRKQAYTARRAQRYKEENGHKACSCLMQLQEYRRSHTVMWYLSHRSELPTRPAIVEALDSGKRIAIPYCERARLKLWQLHALQELVPGSYGILEPPKQRWSEAGRRIDPVELDLIVVPGVGFDRKGNRLGSGQGYYDRLMSHVRPQTWRIAVCYESQLLDEVPVAPHDVPMHMIITEKQIYVC
jgi:5-formyltetrahydrofolate cyclo-ligase